MALMFSNLGKDTVYSILNKDVIFQGHRSTLSLLIGVDDVEDCGRFFSGETLQMLLTNEVLEIGQKLPDFIQYCVPHPVSRSSLLRLGVLRTNELNNVFVISNATAEDLENLIPPNEKVVHVESPERKQSTRFMIVEADDAETRFSELCKTYPSVHWLHFAGRTFEWRRSQANINIIRDNIVYNWGQVNLEHLLEIPDEVIVMWREQNAEMSNPLPYLAQKAKNYDPNVWVVHIKPGCDSEFFDRTSDLTPEEVLVSAAKLQSPLELNLFHIYMKCNRNIIVLVDLCFYVPHFQKKCTTLLLALSKLKVKKVIVSCYFRDRICFENVLSTISFRVNNFAEEHQINFLCNFWKSSPLNKNNLEALVKKCVKLLNTTCLPDPSSYFAKMGINIPIATVIIAEVFCDYAMHPVDNELPKKSNLVDIFEKFVDKKFRNTLSKFPTTLSEGESKELYLRNHMFIALASYVNAAHIQKMLRSHYNVVKSSADAFLIDILKNPETSGMITDVVNDIPRFTHSVLSVYFIALFFSQNFELCKDFLLNYLFTHHFQAIRVMFDNILARDRQLHMAIITNDAAQAEAVLKSGKVDVNATDSGGRSALHLAASLCFGCSNPAHGHFDSHEQHISPHLVELLLNFGAHVNMRDFVFHFSPLEYALQTRSWEAMENLLARGASKEDVKIPQQFHYDVARYSIPKGCVNVLELSFDSGLRVDFSIGMISTLLHKACEHGHVNVVNFLLARGADKRAFIDGKNPLHLAVKCGHTAVVQALIQFDKPVKVSRFLNPFPLLRKYVNVPTSEGESPLLMASRGQSSELIQLLVRHGADMSITDNYGQTILHRACRVGNSDVVHSVIEMFLHRRDASSLINKLDKQGETAVFIAVMSNNADVLKLLISNGGNVFFKYIGKSMLHLASEFGHCNIVNIIKDHFINELDILDDRGRSPLHFATWASHIAVVELIMLNGGNIWVLDPKGRTCVHLAAWKGNLCLLQVLLNNARDKDSIRDNINVIDKEGKTALHLASYWGHIFTDVIRLLVIHGADPRIVDEDGRSCLHLTCCRGNVSSVQEILNYFTADETPIVSFVNGQDKVGKSPMHLASLWGHSDVAELLISNGADVWVVDDDGNTCLHLAATRCELSAAKVIVDSLNDVKTDVFKYVNICNKDGLTASDLATMNKVKDKVVDFLTWIENILKGCSPIYVSK